MVAGSARSAERTARAAVDLGRRETVTVGRAAVGTCAGTDWIRYRGARRCANPSRTPGHGAWPNHSESERARTAPGTASAYWRCHLPPHRSHTRYRRSGLCARSPASAGAASGRWQRAQTGMPNAPGVDWSTSAGLPAAPTPVAGVTERISAGRIGGVDAREFSGVPRVDRQRPALDGFDCNDRAARPKRHDFVAA